MNNPALIPFDCADEEIGLVLRQALSDLKQSADGLFKQASKRMDECQCRLQDYCSRLASVESKLKVIQQSEEVPLITSPADFPGKIYVSRPLVFSRYDSLTPFINSQRDIKYEQSAKLLSIKEMVLRKNGYKFIFPKGKYNETLLPKKKLDSRFASPVKTIDKKRGLIQPMDLYNLKLVTSPDILFSPGLDLTPNSMLIYDNLKAIDSNDPFTYKPGKTYNPTEFDLPDDLPQLTGVTRSSYTQKESIFGGRHSDEEDDDDVFSEATKRSLNLDLSARSSFYVIDNSRSRHSTKSKLVIPAKHEQLPTLSRVQVPSTSATAADQFLISPVVSTEISPNTSVPESVVEAVVLPPRNVDEVSPKHSAAPPPPPPPTNLLIAIPSPPIPGRSDLMEAIRAAGGAKKAGLKKTKTMDDDETTAEKPTSKASAAVELSDDLMSSLAKALERRRKGISGKTIKKFEALEKSAQKTTSNTTFSSLRELIPLPVKQTESDSDQSVNDDEEDWK